jgi:hypothetical protein
MTRHIRTYIFLCLATIAFASCEKPDEPVTLPPIPEGVELKEIPMGETYDRQIFYNLQTGQQFVADMNQWDLQFESGPNGRMVMMNGGREVLAANSGKTAFGQVSAAQLAWHWDRTSGHPDSIFLSRCYGTHPNDTVYVIDRGARVAESERYFQIKFIHVDANKYKIEIADINGNNAKIITIPKDHQKLHVYFTYTNGGTALNFEPHIQDWHFCFKRYRWVYYEYSPPLLYTVVGVYINPHKVEVAVDSSMAFNDITQYHALQMTFSSKQDIIGFEWKWPDFTASGVRYICRKNWNYIIREKSPEHPVYKMRFIDFYNDQGVKGYPNFELKRIN